MQCLVTEPRAWLLLANTASYPGRSSGEIQRWRNRHKRGKGAEESGKEQKGPAHGCTPWSQREEPSVSPSNSPDSCERGSVAGKPCPVRHITLQGSALAGLKLKILQEARTGQELLPKESFYLCPADPPAFPALGQEEPRNKEGEKG